MIPDEPSFRRGIEVMRSARPRVRVCMRVCVGAGVCASDADERERERVVSECHVVSRRIGVKGRERESSDRETDGKPAKRKQTTREAGMKSKN